MIDQLAGLSLTYLCIALLTFGQNLYIILPPQTLFVFSYRFGDSTETASQKVKKLFMNSFLVMFNDKAQYPLVLHVNQFDIGHFAREDFRIVCYNSVSNFQFIVYRLVRDM